MKFRGPGQSLHPAKEAQRRQARALRSLKQAVGSGGSPAGAATGASNAASDPPVGEVWRFELGGSDGELIAVHIPTGERVTMARVPSHNDSSEE